MNGSSIKDYYAILGVDKDADTKTIKKAYRKLAMRYHPDKNPDNKSAEEKFKEASEAYSILGDPEKRAQYDMGGSGNIDLADFFASSGIGGLGDIFERFGFRTRQQSQPKPSEKMVKFSVPLSEITSGKSKRVFRIRGEKACIPCNGIGGEHAVICHGCSGSGQMSNRTNRGGISFTQSFPCSLCHGRGKLISGLCKTCHGVGLIETQDIYDVEIIANKRK